MIEKCITCKYYKKIKNKPLPKCMYDQPVNILLNGQVISMLPDVRDNDFCSKWVSASTGIVDIGITEEVCDSILDIK